MLLRTPCHHWSISSWVVKVVEGTWEPGLIHTGAPGTFMLILAQCERNKWRPPSHHIMWECSHNLIVIQSEKQLQDFNANGCHVAHRCLVFSYAVVLQCCYELSSCCVGGLRSKCCRFFRLDEKLKIGLSEVSKSESRNTDAIKPYLFVPSPRRGFPLTWNGQKYQCLMISRPSSWNTLCVTGGSTRLK